MLPQSLPFGPSTREVWEERLPVKTEAKNPRVHVCCELPTYAMVERGAESLDDSSFYQLFQVAGASGLSEKLSIGTLPHFTLNNARLSIFSFVNCQEILL